jgi:type IV secretory pathway VirB10-like protein
MFEIINGMASEMNTIKGVVSQQQQLMAMRQPPMEGIHDLGIPVNHLFSQNSQMQEPPVVHHGQNVLTSIGEMDNNDDEEEDSDDEEEEEDSDEEEEDSDDEPEMEAVKLNIEFDDSDKIVVSDNEEEPIEDVTPNVEEIVTEEVQEDLQKLTLAKLKTLAVEKGLVENASKMKKSELLDLIQSK